MKTIWNKSDEATLSCRSLTGGIKNCILVRRTRVADSKWLDSIELPHDDSKFRQFYIHDNAHSHSRWSTIRYHRRHSRLDIINLISWCIIIRLRPHMPIAFKKNASKKKLFCTKYTFPCPCSPVLWTRTSSVPFLWQVVSTRDWDQH